MSVAPAEGGDAPEIVELPKGDAAFASLMDALAPEEDAAEGGPAAAGDASAADGGAGADGAGAAAAGSATAGDAGAAGDGGSAAGGSGEAAAGAPGADGGSADGGAADAAAASDRGDRPAAWTADAATLAPQLADLSTKLEENTSQMYQAQALEAAREDYGNYFDALEKHPRLLVGQEVPRIGGEGMERLKDSNDAKEWQEAVKSILVAEVRDRTGRLMEENREFLNTIHSSIELFQKNSDLLPGTKSFDRELADRFASLAEPYELRSEEGRLQGYSVPVQPLVEKLRKQLEIERAKAPAAATPPAAAAPATPKKASEPPQAGIPAKAGSGSQGEDFSTLFGTIGLPNLQI